MPSTGKGDHHLRSLLNHAGKQPMVGEVDVDRVKADHGTRYSRRRPRAALTGATATTTVTVQGTERTAVAAASGATIALKSLLVMLALLSRPTAGAGAVAAVGSTGSIAPPFAPAADSAATASPWVLRVRGGGGRGGGAKGAAAAAAPAYARNPPRDGVLYDELEVHWGATAREIKKAYYRLAVQHHPDKKPGDAQAEDRFKRVSEAYQILQDDAVREKYHRVGVSALEEEGWGESGDGDGNGGGGGGGGASGEDVGGSRTGGSGGEARGRRRRVDPMEVFQMFLGGGMFEHLIGPLSPRMVPVRDPDYHHQKSKVLAEELERRLEVDLQGNSLWFDQAAWAEALQLRDQSMGRQILRTVGYVYKNYAQRSLGKLAQNVLQPQALKGRMKFYSDQAHRVNNLLSAVSSTTRLYVHLQTRKPDQSSSSKHGGRDKSGRTPVERHSADEEETVTRVLEALWSVHRVDVEHTVQRACKMVLRDPRAPPSVQKKRAEALLRLGSIFTAAAKGKHPDPGTFYSVENAPDPFATAAASASASAAPPSPSNSGDGIGASPPPAFPGYGGYAPFGPGGTTNSNNAGGGEDDRVNGGPAEGWREERGGAPGVEQGGGYAPPPPPPPPPAQQGFFGSYGTVGTDGKPWSDERGAGQSHRYSSSSNGGVAGETGGNIPADFAEGLGGSGEGEYGGAAARCVRQEEAPWEGTAPTAGTAGTATPVGDSRSPPPDSFSFSELSGICGGSCGDSRSRQGAPGEMDGCWAGSEGSVDSRGGQGVGRGPSWSEAPWSYSDEW